MGLRVRTARFDSKKKKRETSSKYRYRTLKQTGSLRALVVISIRLRTTLCLRLEITEFLTSYFWVVILTFISRHIPVLKSTVNQGKFSQNLIQKTIEIFYQEDFVVLTPEEACVYLQSLGGLFLAFAKGAGTRVPKGSGTGSPDLITPHSCN